MKAPDKIYLQICGSCENNKYNPSECRQCEIDNPIVSSAITYSFDRIFENDVVYVRADILGRLYNLIKDQKEFFRTKAPGLRDDCKRRENGFLKWYEENFIKKQDHKEQNIQTSLFQ